MTEQPIVPPYIQDQLRAHHIERALECLNSGPSDLLRVLATAVREVQALHPVPPVGRDDVGSVCPTCGQDAPCETARAVGVRRPDTNEESR